MESFLLVYFVGVITAQEIRSYCEDGYIPSVLWIFLSWIGILIISILHSVKIEIDLDEEEW